MIMENELYDKPGIIIVDDKVSRTTKVKKFVEKNKLTSYQIIYLEKECKDFKEVERALKELEANYLGETPPKEKPKPEGLRECPFKYRVNTNTVLEAFTQEDLDKLKSWWNIKD